MKNFSKAQDMLSRAYDMFPLHIESTVKTKNAFPMYSFERVSSLFWSSFIEELFDKGLNESQVEWVLRSKNMRWMFDQKEDLVCGLAQFMASDSIVSSAIAGEKPK